jgi:hypothetical protein
VGTFAPALAGGFFGRCARLLGDLAAERDHRWDFVLGERAMKGASASRFFASRSA